jgi:RNA-directed DNA polymerase
VKPRLRGKVFVVRYADDAVLCFQYREDAEKVLHVLPKRFARYGLELCGILGDETIRRRGLSALR